MQSLPLIAVSVAVAAASLATLAGFIVNAYKKGIENAKRKEREAEYAYVSKLRRKCTQTGNNLLALNCREWLQKYEAGTYAPFTFTEADLLPGGDSSPLDSTGEE